MTKLIFNKEYPIAKEILTQTGKNRILSDFEKFGPIIEKSLENSEIISTEFADIKYYLNKFVQESYTELISKPYLYAGQYAKQPKELSELSVPYEVRSIGPYLKKLNKLPTECKNCEMYINAKKLTDELSNLFEVYSFLKEHTVKASVKKKEAKELKEIEENEWIKKLVSHKDTKKVIELLTSTVTDIENKLYESRLVSLKSIVEKYKKFIENGNSDYLEIYKNNGFAKMCIQGIVERIDKNFRYNAPKEFKLVNNYDEIINKQAKDYAKEITNTFVYKNTHKLSYILYTKNNLDSVNINNVSLGNGYIECDLICKFKDKSEFLANTSIVLSYSKYDKPFYRYPTIFKNVKLADGSILSEPSEEKMDEIFATNNTNSPSIKRNKIK